MMRHEVPTMKRTVSRHPFPFFLCLLAVAASNVRLLGAYIFMFAGVSYLGIHLERIHIGKGVIPLVLFSLTYFFFSYMHGDSLISAAKIFICPMLWLVGYNMPERREIKSVFKVMIFLSMGMVLHGIANCIYNEIVGTAISAGRTLDFWSGTISAATGQAINFSLFIAISFWLIAVQNVRWLRMVALLIYLISLVYDIQLGGRTFFVLSFVAIGLGLMFYLYEKVFKRWELSKLVFQAFIALILIATLIYIVKHDILGIRSMYEGSYLYVRLNLHNAADIMSSERFNIKAEYLKNLLAAPWGGDVLLNEIVGSYAHDLWLDIYNDVGVFPTVFVMIYTFFAIGRVLMIGRCRGVAYEYRAALLSYIITIMLQFCVEPILQGAPMLFYSFIIIDGLLAGFCVQGAKGWLEKA